MKTTLALAFALALAPGLAAAQPKHAILVLKSDGNADAKLRGKIDAVVLKLAKGTTDGQVTAGDLSYVDAALAAGCKPEAPTCPGEVMATFGADELVITSVARKPGIIEVSVRRTPKSATSRDATAKVPADATDIQLDSVGVLFGVAPPPPVPAPPPVVPTTNLTNQPDKPIETTPPVDPVTPPSEPTAVVPSTTPAPTPAPTLEPGPVDDAHSRRGLYVAGMIGGGVFVMIGFGLWSSASDVQSQINAAPNKSVADFDHIKSLETRGDKLASGGNLMFLAGAVIGGISTYYFVKDRRHRAAQQHAMIGPTLFDHGAGIAFTFGATP